jgi:protein phosphatase
VIRFRAGSASDIGRVRGENQDACLVHDLLFVVADGMGGHNGGEVASLIAVDTLRERFPEVDAERTTDALVEAVQIANEAVIAEASTDPSLRGMGTTVVALAAVESHGEERIAIANVGDSRCYLLEGEQLRQITRDHSVVQTLVEAGQLTEAEAEQHPHRNVLTRALGIDGKVMTDSWELLPFAGDRYLLCSDGLFNELSEPEMADVLRRFPNPGEAADELVRLANDAGGRDNISAVVIDVVEDGGRSDDAAAAMAEARSRITEHMTGQRRAIVIAGSETSQAPDVAAAAAATSEAVPASAVADRTARKPGPSYRAILFVAVVIGVLVLSVAAVFAAGRGSYFVGYDGANHVAIYRGHPGGFLIFDPTLQETTTIERGQVPSAYASDIDNGKPFGSLKEAKSYVDRVKSDIAVAGGGQGATSTTTAPTTTAAPPGG